uniref:DUF4806 domain-containing protein n=1 Tax=Anopheles dirus TaxID=7168 RepID=A0A182NWE4_9DIPT
MPYAIVESTDAIGKKELLIVPETWIQTDTQKATYVSWPNARTISKLRALLEDESSVPSVAWERQECEVICRNIPSLDSADKLMETMQKQCTDQSSISVMDADEMIVSECSSEDEAEVKNEQPKAGEENQEIEEDPLVDMRPFPQLLNLIFELKSLMEYNQQEIGKKLEEGFFRIQKTIISLAEKNHDWIRKDLHLNSVCEHGMERFKINVFKTKEELDVFEQKLNDAKYKKKVQNWIDFAVGHTQTANHRMHELIDLIFDRKLFASFSWTGAAGTKHALRECVNIVGLFEYAANSGVERVSDVSIATFFQRKLNHATARLLSMTGARRPVPRNRSSTQSKRKKNENANAQQTNRGDQADTKQPSPSKTSEKIQKQVVTCEQPPSTDDTRADSSVTKKRPAAAITAQRIKEQAKLLIRNYQKHQPSVSLKPTRSSYVPITLSPVKSMEEMDALEAQLNDSECKKHVQNWINATVGHMPDNHSRMVELIDHLIDPNLLQNFNWS